MYLDYVKKQLSVPGKKVCIFPMGVAGRYILSMLRSIGVNIDFFCDHNPELWGIEYQGVTCLTIEELQAQAQDMIVLVESQSFQEIKEQLIGEGITNIVRIFWEKIPAESSIKHIPDIYEKIALLKEVCEDSESRDVVDHITNFWFAKRVEEDYFEKIKSKNTIYFDKDIIRLSDQEALVDAGAYIGDTAQDFLDVCRGRYEKMHLFELDPAVYKELMNTIPLLQAKNEGGG